jgi:hypothetical protein
MPISRSSLTLFSCPALAQAGKHIKHALAKVFRKSSNSAQQPTAAAKYSDQQIKRFTDKQKQARNHELAELRTDPTQQALNTYLGNKILQGKRVQGHDLQRLYQANDSVMQTRNLLVFGRGNVSIDIEKSGHESSRRVEGLRDYRKILDKAYLMRATTSDQALKEAEGLHDSVALLAAQALHAKHTSQDRLEHKASQAVAIQAFKSGNCGEYALLAEHLHSAHAMTGEKQVVRVKGSNIDHHWVEDRKPQGVRIIIDPWSDGPAVLAEDSRFAKEQQPSELLSSASGDSAHQAYLAKLRSSPTIQVDAYTQPYRNHQYHINQESTWDPTPVISATFLQGAKQARLARINKGLKLEINKEYLSPELPRSKGFKTHVKKQLKINQEIKLQHRLKRLIADDKQDLETLETSGAPP